MPTRFLIQSASSASVRRTLSREGSALWRLLTIQPTVTALTIDVCWAFLIFPTFLSLSILGKNHEKSAPNPQLHLVPGELVLRGPDSCLALRPFAAKPWRGAKKPGAEVFPESAASDAHRVLEVRSGWRRMGR